MPKIDFGLVALPLALGILTGGVAEATPPANTTAVDAGCTGGVTGGGDGATITADDHLVRWTLLTSAMPRVETGLGLSADLAAEIRGDLQAIGFEAVEYDVPGMLACFVSYLGHTVIWSPGDPAAPSAIVAMHARLMEAAED